MRFGTGLARLGQINRRGILVKMARLGQINRRGILVKMARLGFNSHVRSRIRFKVEFNVLF